MPSLERAIATFEAKLPELLKDEGKFVVIKSDRVEGVREAYADALRLASPRLRAPSRRGVLGETHRIDAADRELLARRAAAMPSVDFTFGAGGPLPQVEIGVSAPRRNPLQRARRLIPPTVSGTFLIDTGASHSAVDPGLLPRSD